MGRRSLKLWGGGSLHHEDVQHFLVPILRAHLFSGELLEFFATLCRENIDFQIT